MSDKGVVIVTGGGSGIGRAAAKRLLAEGWPVVAVDRDAGGLKSLAEEEAGGRLRTETLDVTDEDAVNRLVRGAARDMGTLAGLVNSAGIARVTPFLETTPAMFRDIYEVNVVGAFVVAKAAAEAMRDGGSIVNIASVSGMRGNVGRAAYGASKGALIALTKIMAVELAGAGIRVNAVAPGPIETAMAREMHAPAVREEWHRTVPLRRYGSPEEVAGTILYLLDPGLSAYVTGQVLAVDGGFVAGGLLGQAAPA